MNYIFIFLSLFLRSVFFGQQNVHIQVMYTNQYCGGARPTQEIMDHYNNPQNLSNSLLQLKGKKNMTVKTDSLGCINLRLREGNYLVFMTDVVNKQLFLNYDPKCLKMLHTEFSKIQIEKGKKNYTINLYFPCNFCEPKNKP